MAKDHFLHECRYRKKEKKEDNNNDKNEGNVVESEVRETVTMISEK